MVVSLATLLTDGIVFLMHFMFLSLKMSCDI